MHEIYCKKRRKKKQNIQEKIRILNDDQHLFWKQKTETKKKLIENAINQLIYIFVAHELKYTDLFLLFSAEGHIHLYN